MLRGRRDVIDRCWWLCCKVISHPNHPYQGKKITPKPCLALNTTQITQENMCQKCRLSRGVISAAETSLPPSHRPVGDTLDFTTTKLHVGAGLAVTPRGGLEGSSIAKPPPKNPAGENSAPQTASTASSFVSRAQTTHSKICKQKRNVTFFSLLGKG